MATTTSGIYYPDPSDTFLPAQDMQALANSVEVYVGLPMIKCGKSGTQSIPNNVVTAVTWDTEWYKSPTGITHSTVTNSDRVIPTRPGWYELEGSVLFNNNATGERRAYVGKNGTQYAPLARAAGLSNVQYILQTSTLISFNGTTDYGQVFAFQDSGGALNIVGDGTEAAAFNCCFTLKFVRPL